MKQLTIQLIQPTDKLYTKLHIDIMMNYCVLARMLDTLSYSKIVLN